MLRLTQWTNKKIIKEKNCCTYSSKRCFCLSERAKVEWTCHSLFCDFFISAIILVICSVKHTFTGVQLYQDVTHLGGKFCLKSFFRRSRFSCRIRIGQFLQSPILKERLKKSKLMGSSKSLLEGFWLLLKKFSRFRGQTREPEEKRPLRRLI